MNLEPIWFYCRDLERVAAHLPRCSPNILLVNLRAARDALEQGEQLVCGHVAQLHHARAQIERELPVNWSPDEIRRAREAARLEAIGIGDTDT